MTSTHRTVAIALAAFALAPLLAALAVQDAPPAPWTPASETPVAAPTPESARADHGVTEPLEVVKVVDGDTVHVLRDDQVEKLRLLSVDTEERIYPDRRRSTNKPMTLFGEESGLWAEGYFASFADEDGKTRVRLLFPDGKEERGTFGRLLCHVLLPDGTDFNLLLVESGKSPYFNKYGNSRVAHDAFVAAQEKARALQLGIWNPAVNRPKTPGAPVYRRDYERLLPWWDARATALENYWLESTEDPFGIFDSEDGDLLELAHLMGDEVRVFGTVERVFEENDGSRTFLLRAQDDDKALRVRVPAAAKPALEPADLDGLTEAFRQNYAWFSGTITMGERGFELVLTDPQQVERAGPEPQVPAAK